MASFVPRVPATLLPLYLRDRRARPVAPARYRGFVMIASSGIFTTTIPPSTQFITCNQDASTAASVTPTSNLGHSDATDKQAILTNFQLPTSLANFSIKFFGAQLHGSQT